MSGATNRWRADTYHHGDLLTAALEIALEMLSSGNETPSIRSIARRAGVSVTALYHHYTGRAGLLAAAAQIGFERVVLLLPPHQTHASPADMFGEAVQRYVDFAVGNRLLWNLMFDRQLRQDHPELQSAAVSAFDQLRSWLASNFKLPDDSHREHRLLCLWSIMQGLASLRLARLFGRATAGFAGDVARGFAANLPIGPVSEINANAMLTSPTLDRILTPST